MSLGRLGVDHRLDVALRGVAGGPPAAAGHPVTLSLTTGSPPEILKGPKVRLPGRDYLLFEGPLEAAGELGAFVSWEPGGGRSFERQTPSLWWPDDRAWCAGNEVDASFTCVGGSRALIDELLEHPDLEVIELDPSLAFSSYTGLNDNDG